MANINLEEWSNAEFILDRAARTRWEYMEQSDRAILHALLDQIRQNFTMTRFENAYVDNLGRQVGADGDRANSLAADISLFCPSFP
jgi:hypothetical protein